MPRVGVLGTMVWDRIHPRTGTAGPIEEWGGITYTLAAATAACPEDWRIVPIVKVGRDRGERALVFLGQLSGLDVEAGVRAVPEPNNRVELHYKAKERRLERMSGGVPPWTFAELEPILASLDALYINFISGFEMTRDTAARVRDSFSGPIYADLHSLLLDIEPGGLRTPRPLDSWREWVGCFDAVQVNEEELALLAPAGVDPWHFAVEALGRSVPILIVTLGSRGAACVTAPGLEPGERCIDSIRIHSAAARPGPARKQRLPSPLGPMDGDPTGCGDVFGATFWCELLGGRSVGGALEGALGAAARNVGHRGATGLHHHLSPRTAS